jgi:hypothetical protein
MVIYNGYVVHFSKQFLLFSRSLSQKTCGNHRTSPRKRNEINSVPFSSENNLNIMGFIAPPKI